MSQAYYVMYSELFLKRYSIVLAGTNVDYLVISNENYSLKMYIPAGNVGMKQIVTIDDPNHAFGLIGFRIYES